MKRIRSIFPQGNSLLILTLAGVAPRNTVLAFNPPFVRYLTDYAVG